MLTNVPALVRKTNDWYSAGCSTNGSSEMTQLAPIWLSKVGLAPGGKCPPGGKISYTSW